MDTRSKTVLVGVMSLLFCGSAFAFQPYTLTISNQAFANIYVMMNGMQTCMSGTPRAATSCSGPSTLNLTNNRGYAIRVSNDKNLGFNVQMGNNANGGANVTFATMKPISGTFFLSCDGHTTDMGTGSVSCNYTKSGSNLFTVTIKTPSKS